MLYGRAQYDEEMELIDTLSQGVSKWLVVEGEAGNRKAGLTALAFEGELESRRKSAKGKLLATMSILSDGDAKRKQQKNVRKRLNKFEIRQIQAEIAEKQAALAKIA
jgi:hypothetical protein